MAILSGTGLVYVHGTDGSVWKEIWGVSRAIDAIWGGAVGMGLGAWLGAVPIPLDWLVLFSTTQLLSCLQKKQSFSVRS